MDKSTKKIIMFNSFFYVYHVYQRVLDVIGYQLDAIASRYSSFFAGWLYHIPGIPDDITIFKFSSKPWIFEAL